jgi:hypothetical protein
MTKTKAKTTGKINELAISQGTIRALGAFSGLVGSWVAACFIGAIVVSGGPLELVKNYFQAITGM